MMDLGHLSGILFAMLFMVRLGKASTLAARAPLDTDSGDGDNDADDQTTIHFFTPTLSLSGSTSTSQPTSSAGFAFNTPSTLTVCGAATLSWSYAGDSTFTIYAIQNEGTGSNALTTQLTVIAGGQDTTSFNWSPVNVPAGSYTLEAYVPSLAQIYYSDTFSVLAGSDTSCLTGSSSSSSSIGTSMSSGTSAPAASTPTSAAIESVSSTSTGNTTGVPVVGAVSGGSTMSHGGIAGIVIGVLAFVGALIAALLLFRRYRSSTASGAPRGGLFEKRRPAGAVTINSRGGSFSSTHGGPARGAGSTFATTPHYNLSRSRSDLGRGTPDKDIGGFAVSGEKPIVPTSAYELGVTTSATYRPPHAYRDSLGSVVSGTTAVPSPVTNNYKSARHSSLLYTSDPFGSSASSPRPSGDYGRSDDQSQVPVALYNPPSVDSTPRGYGSPGVPRDISIASSSLPDFAYESDIASPSAAVIASNVARRAAPAPPNAVPASTSAQPARRSKSASARKPVPVYTPSISGEPLELVEPPTPRSSAGQAGSYYNSSSGQHSGSSLAGSSSGGNDWSSAAAHSHSPASGMSPTSSGSYLPHGGSSLSGLAGRPGMPELNHKSSFGERQMHVLMPDLPTEHMQ